jgi:4'-phosphopantetheinyl transferase
MRHDLFTTGSAASDGSVPLPDLRRLPLPKKTVQIWLLDDTSIEPACSAFANTLSADERQRARAYRQQRHRNSFVARRSILRWLISAYLFCKPESLRFSVTQFGKPVLQGPDAERLAFSVSHTDGMALLAFAWDCCVGVDVEQRIDGLDIAGVGRGIFSAIEEETIDGARPDPAASLLSIWTRKEALLKALGPGLSGQPNAYTTEDDPLLGEGHWCASHNGTAISGWTCLDLVLGPQVRGALAVSLEDARVTLQLCPVSNWANTCRDGDAALTLDL